MTIPEGADRSLKWKTLLTKEDLRERPDEDREFFVRLEFRSSGINCRVHGLRVVQRKIDQFESDEGPIVTTGLASLELALCCAKGPALTCRDTKNDQLFSYDIATGLVVRAFPLNDDVDVLVEEGSLLEKLTSFVRGRMALDQDPVVKHEASTLVATAPTSAEIKFQFRYSAT